VGLNLQAADVLVNLDLPWNPARLEQRIARVHRIGSRRTVQVILLVTKESLEERILALHETKRNVLENVWAKGGEDTIAAPGGSGAFREMLRELLKARAPQPPPAQGTPAPGREVEEPPGAATEEAKPQGLVAAVLSAPSSPAEKAPPPRSALESAPPAGVVVDPQILAAAIASIVPALPPDHRRSLATVFRSLAEALEGPTT
jgi:hypothetical protein